MKVLELDKIRIGNELPLVLIAGPCVVENEKITFETAETIKQIANDLNLGFVFKSSFKKANRTNINSFVGLEEDEAFDILRKIKSNLDLPILTDVHKEADVEKVADFADIIQIPAFLSRQTDLLLSAGRSGKIVNVKKGQFMAPEDMKHTIEKISSTGNDKIMLTERGTTFGYHNLVVDMRSLVIMKELGYPIVMDATHSVQIPSGTNVSGGEPKFIEPLSKAAAAIGIDALFLEVHPNPKEALSDAGSQLKLSDLKNILKKIIAIDKTVKNYE